MAKVRDGTCSGCSSSVILKTNMAGGHFGEGGRYRQCEVAAYDYAFLIKAMGMLKTEKQDMQCTVVTKESKVGFTEVPGEE